MVPIDRLLNMTCTLRSDADGSESSSSWGHGVANPQTYATGVKCNLQPDTGGEIQRQFVEAAQRETYRLYLEWRADLLAIGAERSYDVVSIVDEVGNTVHAGPLDILAVRDPTGRRSHLEIMCVAKALA